MIYSSLLVIFKKKDVNYCCSPKKKMVEIKKFFGPFYCRVVYLIIQIVETYNYKPLFHLNRL